MKIEGGTVFITVSGPQGFEPYNYTADLCDVVNRKCPLKEGKKFKAKAKIPIFADVFPPGNYTVRQLNTYFLLSLRQLRAEVESIDNEIQLSCINAELDFVSKK